MKTIIRNGILEKVPLWCNHIDGDWREATPEEIAVLEQSSVLLSKELDYRQLRRAEYPEWQELAEAIVEEKSGLPEKMQQYLADVAVIKQKYPKPDTNE